MTQVAERNDSGRKRILAAIEHVCPFVHGNPFIPHWPTAPQAMFLGLHMASGTGNDEVFRALYGGAAGGGKSDTLLMAAAQYAWKFGEFAGILFRRSHTDLAQPGALMDRAMSWWLPAGASWDGTNKIFRFPSGAKVAMAYLASPQDHLRYQGAEYQYSGWDELTQWKTPSQYEYVGLSRLRRAKGSNIPLRTLAGCNPGGPGHDWVKRMFIGGVNPETGVYEPPKHRYVPAKLQDNPHIDQSAYMKGLMHLHPTVREQLLNGDWRAREPGDYFRAEWFGPLLDPATDLWPSSDCLRIRWWDLAASESKDAARTAGVLMARHRSGVRAVEHAKAFRMTPGSRDDAIVQTALSDGHGVVCGLEIEPGSGGPAQFYAIEKRLRAYGIKVVGARPGAPRTDSEGKTMLRQPSSESGKASRADPVASCCERGYQRRGEGRTTGAAWWEADAGLPASQQRDGVRLFMGPWTQDYLDEMEGFPDGARCDLVDATSGAWAWLEAHPAGASMAPRIDTSLAKKANSMDQHPTDRDAAAAKTPKWRP